MGLYQNWQENIEKATPANAQKILEEYYEKEKNAYIKILGEKKQELSGKASEVAAELDLTEDEFGGFVDGINTSLETAVDVEALEADSDVTLKIKYARNCAFSLPAVSATSVIAFEVAQKLRLL